MIPTGLAMTSEPLAFMADPLYILHKGLGSVLLVLVFTRIAWRLIHRPPPYPDAVPTGQRRIMRRTHAGLYVLLAAMTVSGYVRTVGDGFPIELLDALGVEPLIPEAPAAAGVALVIHQVGAYALAALAAAHAAAAIHDRLFGRTGAFERMGPGRAPADSSPPEIPPRQGGKGPSPSSAPRRS